MKKNIKISPIGLKGYQINERMKELMGVSSLNENKSNVVVELTKLGPDGNAYAIIRENHEWYIKKANKTENLVAEDFNYIGGLMNKKSEAYPSYAKAIKHLNLKFRNLAEAYNFEGEINLFLNDNLITENGFSEMKGNGFSGKGNLEGNEKMFEEEETECDDVEMSEAEKAIDAMLSETEEEDDDEEEITEEEEQEEEIEAINENKLSIAKLMKNMDGIIDGLKKKL